MFIRTKYTKKDTGTVMYNYTLIIYYLFCIFNFMLPSSGPHFAQISRPLQKEERASSRQTPYWLESNYHLEVNAV